MKLGIIAEDYSDVSVVKQLTIKLLNSRKIGFKQFVGNGCGKLRRKCQAWADNLARQGCSWILVVHDLDQNNETNLRNQLEHAIDHANVKARIVIIPIREIESWLLFDANAIRIAFNGRISPRLPSAPESLSDPKKELCDLVWRSFKKQYINTIHNERIAQNINLNKLRHARSFNRYPIFVNRIREDARIRL